VLLGKSEMGNREALLSFIGPDLVSVRWKQWRIYFKDMKLTGTGQQMVGGIFADISGMSYPKVYNIEMDPHEDLNVGGIHFWPMIEASGPVSDYLGSLNKYPNPSAVNFTNFGGGG
jgi:arylsulfatase